MRHFVTASSVTLDGGQHWQQVVPPITPDQFSGDPGLAFTQSGRLYFSNAFTHETPDGPLTSPSIAVAHSDDGGFTWSNPVSVVQGIWAFVPQASGPATFNDKPFITADTYSASPFSNRAYVTWSSFESRGR